jgi:hypothetical protein
MRSSILRCKILIVLFSSYAYCEVCSGQIAMCKILYKKNCLVSSLLCCDIIVCAVAGIRSQSKPHDIMQEVYRAMKTLDYVCVFFFLFICST